VALLKLMPALLLGACSLVTDSDELRFPEGGADTTADSTDTGRPDTAADTTVPPDTAQPDTADVPEKRLVVRHSGENGCTLEYRSLLNCPTACAWTLVVDASESVGHGAFAWRFSATNSYRVSPSSASGARVTIEVDTPECGLTPPTVGPGKVIAELSADGGPYVIGASIDFAVQQVTSCGDDDLCPAP
jgi:hypothetical protein